jgi:5-amino-6-(5-phospho-D-ribitylamino)uracil phosphatase
MMKRDARQIKLIAVDLDGTLLTSAKSLSPETLRTLETCKKNGLIVVIATARGELAASAYLPQIDPDFAVLNGGALIMRKEKRLRSIMLDKKMTNSIIAECVGNKQITKISVETGTGYYVNFPLDGTLGYSHAVYRDFSVPMDEEAYKITIEAGQKEVPEKIAAVHGCGVLSYYGESWYRIAHCEASKWNAVSYLLDTLSLSPENVCSFGDDYNDIEMIANSGIGVCVENGIPELKKIAAFITRTNDNDGVSYYLNNHFLPDRK